MFSEIINFLSSSPLLSLCPHQSSADIKQAYVSLWAFYALECLQKASGMFTLQKKTVLCHYAYQKHKLYLYGNVNLYLFELYQ